MCDSHLVIPVLDCASATVKGTLCFRYFRQRNAFIVLMQFMLLVQIISCSQESLGDNRRATGRVSLGSGTTSTSKDATKTYSRPCTKQVRI